MGKVVILWLEQFSAPVQYRWATAEVGYTQIVLSETDTDDGRRVKADLYAWDYMPCERKWRMVNWNHMVVTPAEANDIYVRAKKQGYTTTRGEYITDEEYLDAVTAYFANQFTADAE